MKKHSTASTSSLVLGASLLLAGTLQPALGADEVMQGFPPAPELRVTKANAFQPPFLRWSIRHAREVSPTRDIRRAQVPLALPGEPVQALDQLAFSVGEVPLTLERYLRESTTDGLIVLHRGKVVYERYLDGFEAGQPHIWASMTKSVTGLLAAQFIAEGRLDPQARLSTYVPELAGTPFGEATLQANLDMQVAVAYPEQVPPDLGLFAAAGLIPRAAHMPTDIYAYLHVAQPVPGAGPLFFYQNGSAEAVAWALRRVSGQNWAQLVSERLWSRFAQDDAYVQVDELGTEMASGGISSNLRDSARFAELVRLEMARAPSADSFNQAVRSTFEPGDAALFAKGDMGPGRPGYAYRNYWYQSNDGDGSVEASGRFGQKIYINPKREVVIVKLSSTLDQARRATQADGSARQTARAVDSPAAFSGMVKALLGALPG
ncbi:serine hydrolase domain-containing protein [Pseudomonas sp. NPDC089401]|uniref:serine hydrolase domain-containing protein n=1 Tax=Pseudomonas sp. NPDC089401 TaxID=3364462 RepID=UPI00381FC539